MFLFWSKFRKGELHWYNYSGAYTSKIMLKFLYEEEPSYISVTYLTLFWFVNNLYVKCMLNLWSKDYNRH